MGGGERRVLADGVAAVTLVAVSKAMGAATGDSSGTLADVDAAPIRLAEPRAFTQAIAAWMYDQSAPDGRPLAGVQFSSRHGDGLIPWAVFERPGDDDISALLRDPQSNPIDEDDPELRETMRTHRLQWSSNA